jgi:hypothetical protein
MAMTDVVDLNAERSKRDQPDPEFVMTDDSGRTMYAFGLDYRMDGKRWSAMVWAYSHEDAENRAKAMRESLTVYGQIMCSVPG